MIKGDDTVTFEGKYKNGFLLDKGIVKLANGSVYEGKFVKGKFQKIKGKEVYNDKTIYEGTFRNDVKSGQGTMISKDGFIYKGSWKNDKFSGKGVLT